ncbi:hypothetical protein EZV62_024010 [Acer yangbiense]|uniref:Uncharacterized protein n=1 Tax=Acer yangbiense TaxID=1000413 RepID=A0A5C7H5F4_9ROSI|nr:hypothetical protein EZV62_024010 [Acer yangbiense]
MCYILSFCTLLSIRSGLEVPEGKLKQAEIDLDNAKKELAAYIGPDSMMPALSQYQSVMAQHVRNPASVVYVNPLRRDGKCSKMGVDNRAQLVIHEQPLEHQHHQQQIFEDQLPAAMHDSRKIVVTYVCEEF